MPTAKEQHIECCSFCATPYLTGEAPPGQEWYCKVCKKALPARAEIERNISISRLFALIGLLLLVPAFAMPMLVIEQFGVRTETGLVRGVITLFHSGEFFLAAVIGVLSGLLPCLKLAGLLMLTSGSSAPNRGRLYRWLYTLVEFSGRWGMIDVFLTAVMVFAFKFSTVLTINARPGLVAFTAMVFCNLMATAFFDTRIYRSRSNDTRK